MALTVDQLAQELQSIGEDLPRSLDRVFESVADIVKQEIQANTPVDTGALRNSIRVRLVDGQFMGVSMLYYGWFQNYGVAGTQTDTAFGVPAEVAQFLPPRTGEKYSFKRRKFGLKAQSFVDLERVSDRIVELINQNLEL